MIRAGLLAALVLLVTTGAVTPVEGVEASPESGRSTPLPERLLLREGVREHLDSGLTTVFLLRAGSRGEKGGASIEIRHELWDRKYLVHLIDQIGSRNESFSSFEQLAEWWSTIRVTVLKTKENPARVTLEVLPFSAFEQRDAQRWLVDSVRRNERQSEARELLELMIGTTVRSRPILRMRWQLGEEIE